MVIDRQINVQHQSNLDKFVHESFISLIPNDQEITVLDIGAGSSPYKEFIEQSGFKYFSHDFNSYIPNTSELGLQNPTWEYAKHNFICDILEIDETNQFDIVLCTEVLEHVPDPAAGFKKISQLLKPNGSLIATVPFMSLMHQAPHWHSSGLSPFWFEYWSRNLNFSIDKLIISGDYVDFFKQELSRIFLAKEKTQKLGMKILTGSSLNFLRNILPDQVLQCGGLTTMYVGHKQK
jgi:SAM-dependent methyltransferase